MSTPYERILQSAASRPSRSSQDVKPSSSSGRLGADGSMTPTSSQANTKKLMTMKRPKPILPFFVRPRFRFDLPDPPMDPKMLLGLLSTTPYAEPFVSEVEREFRPIATPADPSHALRANLSSPAVPRPSSAPPHKLTIDDVALLQSVVNARLAGSKMNPGDVPRASASGVSNIVPSAPLQTQASNVSNAAWMRRMSYDEYITRSGHKRSSISAVKPEVLIKKSEKDASHVLAMREKRRKQLLATFTLIRKPPTHPDVRMGHLKPISIAPVFLDFASVGKEFVVLDFDKDEQLTLEERVKEEPDWADESVRSMASVSLGDGTTPRPKEAVKKYIACYTPTDDTLAMRKRKGEDAREDTTGEDEDTKVSSKVRKRRKIHFVENEAYEWIGEYVIREGRYIEDSGLQESGGRSCFAVSQHVSNDGKQRVASFARIGTSWKLSRKPVDESTGRLGKEGLRLHRELDVSVDIGEDVKSKIIRGNEFKRKIAKKEETVPIILGDD